MRLTTHLRGQPRSGAVTDVVDRRVFRLDDAAWAEFTAILDRPAKRITEPARQLGESASWDK